ncbi:oxidative stress defense protein [Caloramator mitchellensis]|uniref:Oxidative stress defense protein n=1 Tax=Caloramator mitchellensis TaxID=908809 RepID=A0A0R3K603_CALMK|nr:SIMPL domain-containing protein [Caloramator mitchellensis]KRQ87823.1 oxidative stress defense protein [Caloramator mitchellensis]
MEEKKIINIVIALIMAIAMVASAAFISNGLSNIKGKQNTITVTGSAKQQIKSDLVKWTGSFSAQSKDLKDAYKQLKESHDKVKEYLTSKGLSEKDLVFSSISTMTNYEILPNGMQSTKIDSYRLYQTVQITSNDVDGITEISRQATELINQGVQFESYPPQYYYTKIADLKVNMLGLATKDAKDRAEQIAKNTGLKIGNLKSAKMGVFQITAPYSTEVADYGIFDTSSVDKEITAVVNCEFEIK